MRTDVSELFLLISHSAVVYWILLKKNVCLCYTLREFIVYRCTGHGTSGTKLGTVMHCIVHEEFMIQQGNDTDTNTTA
jgi:hypothetical protein